MAKTDRSQTPRLYEALTSPIGRKVLTGVTGIGLTLFVLLHMVGNLTYFNSDPDAYNKYSAFLLGLGPALYLLEVLLAIAFLVHAYLGVRIYLRKRAARQKGYAAYKSSGGASKQSVSSRTMIVSGIVLLVFVVIHLKTFKFGPGIESDYVALNGAEQMRDLKRLVTETFQSPLYAFGYTAVMMLLGFHLRHGVWSAFQSIGAMNSKLSPVLYTVGTILAILIAVGFLVLPLWIYFSV